MRIFECSIRHCSPRQARHALMPVSTTTHGRNAAAAPARFVVADASPLIGLATARVFDLLRELFGTVTVSRAVCDEVAAGGERPGARELTAAMRAGWIRVAPTPMATWRLPELDPGEASTLALALEHGSAALVLMDDALGREHAAARGVEIMDVAAILLAAKREGLVDDVGPYLERLARKGFTIPGDLARAALRGAGEAS